MSGIDIELRNTWDFMVGELLSQFNDPKTGYIAHNKGALSYSNTNESESVVAAKGKEASGNVKSRALVEKKDTLKVTDKQSGAISDAEVLNGSDVEEATQDTNIAIESVDELSAKANNDSWWSSFLWSSSSPTLYQDSQEKKLEVESISNYESTWSTIAWAARYKAGDTVELTASKVRALQELVKQVDEDKRAPLKIQKLFLNESDDLQKSESSTDLVAKCKTSKDVKTPKDIKSIELADLQNRITLLRSYGHEAQLKILDSINRVNASRQAQGKAVRVPSTADAYLKIWDNMWEWMETETSLLHVCLAFEGAASIESKGKLWDRRDALEAKFVTYLFRIMIAIKIDHFSNGQATHTGYIRQLDEPEADKLVKKIQDTIKTLNNNVLLYPGLRRINQLISVIDSVQLTVITAFNNTESNRVSILGDFAASWLPSKTPTIIASKPNQFLIKMKDDLRDFNTEAETLKTHIDVYKGSEETQQARARLKQ